MDVLTTNNFLKEKSQQFTMIRIINLYQMFQNLEMFLLKMLDINYIRMVVLIWKMIF